eukprot:4396230-Amphidinium_carterae.1
MYHTQKPESVPQRRKRVEELSRKEKRRAILKEQFLRWDELPVPRSAHNAWCRNHLNASLARNSFVVCRGELFEMKPGLGVMFGFAGVACVSDIKLYLN